MVRTRRGRRLAAAVVIFLCLPAPLAAFAGDRGLVPFVRALGAGEDAGRRVRILHFGDSHLAAQAYEATLRASFQGAFGDGGPGLLLPWTPPKMYALGAVRTDSTPGWRRFVPRVGHTETAGGLLGCYMEANAPGERARASGSFAEVRVVFLRQPGGGSASFLLDGRTVGFVDLQAAQPTTGVFTYRASPASEPHVLEVRTETSGKVRILGVHLESGRPGAVYSALGVVGAHASLLLETEESLFSRQLQLEQPDLVILSFGTNEAEHRSFDPLAYRETLRRVLNRIRRAAPSASLLVTAPPDHEQRRDGTFRPALRLPIVTACLREAAAEAGAAFLDLGALMGGAGSMRRWAGEGLAQADHVHLTGPGYERLARLFLTELFGRLNELRVASGLSGVPFALPPVVVAAHRHGTARREALPDSSTSDIRAYRDAEGRLVLTNSSAARGLPRLGRRSDP